MTVNAEIPYIAYEGNSVTTVFTFTWSSGDANDIYVKRNDVLLTEGVEYELENYTEEYGGEIVFPVAPVATDSIFIYRKTPITQQVDYEEGAPFPADTHEMQMDKDTRILQEMLDSGRAIGGVVNISADQQETYVDILNSSGTDARIVGWTTDGLQSGVSMGEVIPSGGTMPTDGAATTKPDGYIWWGLGQPAAPGSDANITMSTSAITVTSTRAAPDVPRAEFAYFASTGRIGYGYDDTLPAELPAWVYESAFYNPVMASGNYLIQLEKISGDTPSGSAIDTWLDASSDASWHILTNGDFVGIVHLAPDAGGGVPDETYKISRSLTFDVEQT